MTNQFPGNIKPVTNPFNIDIKYLNEPSDPNVNPFGNFKPIQTLNPFNFTNFTNFKPIEKELKSLSPIPYVNTMSKPLVSYPNSNFKLNDEMKPKRNITKLNGKFKHLKFDNIKIKEFEGEIKFDN